MLKRGGKSSYNPYSTGERVKRGKDRLDILPNKHNVWLKQVCRSVNVLLWRPSTDAFLLLVKYLRVCFVRP